MRILVDAWLSGYAVGDLMERTIQVQLDPAKIETIDAVYISHSHTDHFDVYTLYNLLKQGGAEERGGGLAVSENPEHPSSVSTPSSQLLSQGASQKPLLLLPFTLAYLVPLIREYLGDIPLQILYPSEPFFLK